MRLLTSTGRIVTNSYFKRSSSLSVTSFAKNLLCFALVCSTTTSSFSVNSSARMNFSTVSSTAGDSPFLDIDPDYPGTSLQRLRAVHERVKSLTFDQLNGDWIEVRRNLLWAGGLRDIIDAPPGYGYTGHSFNDFNHCDLTTMLEHVSYNENDGKVDGIHFSNQLGPGVKIASIPDLGPGGSWSTCILGNNKNPPQDVAHLQFRSRIAFKLVWVPPDFSTFVLVDDNGDLLATGRPTGRLPDVNDRRNNYRTTIGGKYAREADKLAALLSSKAL